jgi:hypothetical protein
MPDRNKLLASQADHIPGKPDRNKFLENQAEHIPGKPDRNKFLSGLTGPIHGMPYRTYSLQAIRSYVILSQAGHSSQDSSDIFLATQTGDTLHTRL